MTFALYWYSVPNRKPCVSLFCGCSTRSGVPAFAKSMFTVLNQPHTTYCQSAITDQSLLSLWAKPSEPCGGIVIDVETAPLDSGAPLPNSGNRRPSTGVPTGTGPIATGNTRPVGTWVKVASPLYLISLRVSQCPPMLSLSLTLKIAPKFTANPLPEAWRLAFAKSVPVATPSVANDVPAGRPAGTASAGGTICVERSVRCFSFNVLWMYATPSPSLRLGLT